MDANIASSHTTTPLVAAAGRNFLEVVRYLTNKGGADVNKADDDGATPLLFAVQDGHIDVVKYLANEGGADRCQQSRQ